MGRNKTEVDAVTSRGGGEGVGIYTPINAWETHTRIFVFMTQALEAALARVGSFNSGRAWEKRALMM
jgi:hypothetical protein